MKKIILLTALISFLNVFSQEEILSYHTTIHVETSGDLLIEEQITVRAQGYNIKRGIYRTFPTKYKDKLGNRYKVGFDVLEVLRDGAKEDYHIKNVSNGKAVYIGSSDVILSPGVYTYTLKFRTNRQIGFFKDFDELYFNAIGGDWAFLIKEATVTVVLPEGAEIGNITAYSGVYGSSDCNCVFSKENNKAHFAINSSLFPYEQLTIALAWQKGIVYQPTTWDKTVYFFKDNLGILIVLCGLLFVFFTYYSRWRKVGVDPPKGTIFPLFDPPSDFSPAQVSYLHFIGFSQRAITAAIVNMAVHGYLTISQNKKKYTLTKNKEAKAWQLSSEEVSIADALFRGRSSIELDNSNHSAFTDMKNRVQKALKNSLKPVYLRFNAKEANRGILLSIGLIVLAFFITPVVFAIIIMVALIIMGVVFAYLMKAPTPKGRKIMDDIEGFKMYVNTAEKRQLDTVKEPDLTPERFEALLPYAIALGVENKWGKRFDDVLKNSMQG
ncbi:MAG TPA: DUF2207 domain-containing protein, partial [Flavobacteriaceae bacterium]|nr:DUF2207 domain-containing protein [Flavobacteriaceae bacterium]